MWDLLKSGAKVVIALLYKKSGLHAIKSKYCFLSLRHVYSRVLKQLRYDICIIVHPCSLYSAVHPLS